MPGWRNGRRGGLKIRYLYGCVGSIPAPAPQKATSPSEWPVLRLRDGRRAAVFVSDDLLWGNDPWPPPVWDFFMPTHGWYGCLGAGVSRW